MITICDTGPLVAYLNRRDAHHAWAVGIMKQTRPPMLICEPILTEAVYFLREDGLMVDPYCNCWSAAQFNLRNGLPPRFCLPLIAGEMGKEFLIIRRKLKRSFI